MIAAAALQQAVYAKLNVSSVTSLLTAQYGVPAIFTDVPQSPDAELPAFFPYIVIGGDTFTPFDDKDVTGATAIVQVDVYSRAASMLQVKTIAGAVQAVLDRQALTIAGTGWIDTQFEGADFTRDPDGLTKRCIAQYRITYIS